MVHPSYFTKYKQTKKARAEIVRAYLSYYKLAAGCMDCGYNLTAIALDFDHVRGVKRFNLSEAKGSEAWATIRAEVAKCDVVCANCHRVRTQARLRS